MRGLFEKYRNVILFFMAAVLPLFLWNRLQGVDNLYMYAHGEDMVLNGLFRDRDIFSMHEDFGFLYQKWAACILTYGIVKLSGWGGLTVATYVLIFLLLAGLYLFGCKYDTDHRMVSALAVMACAYLMEANGTLRFRPHVMAGLVFLYLFYGIEKYIRQEWAPDIRFYLRFFTASVVLMWFHSTMWIMYLAVFLPYVMNFKWLGMRYPELFVKADYEKKPLWTAMSIMFLAGACNPNGWKQYSYMLSCLKAAGEKYSHVDELQRMPFPAYMVLLTVGCLLLLWVWYLHAEHKVRMDVTAVYLISGSLIMPLISWRLVFYSAMFLAIACMLQTGRMKKKGSGSWAMPAVLCLMGAVTLLAGGLSRLSVRSSSGEALARGTKIQEVIDAVDFVADLDEDASVFTTTAHVGSYGIYRHLKPYMDCRAEVYDDTINKKADILSEIHGLSGNRYHDMVLTEGGINALQRDYQPDYYVLTCYSDADRNIKEALEQEGAACLFGEPEDPVWVYQY